MKVNKEILYHISRLNDKIADIDSKEIITVDGKTLNQSIVDNLDFHSMLDLKEGKGPQGLINALVHDKDNEE